MWIVSEVMLQRQCHQYSLTQAKETLLTLFVTASRSSASEVNVILTAGPR